MLFLWFIFFILDIFTQSFFSFLISFYVVFSFSFCFRFHLEWFVDILFSFYVSIYHSVYLLLTISNCTTLQNVLLYFLYKLKSFFQIYIFETFIYENKSISSCVPFASICHMNISYYLFFFSCFPFKGSYTLYWKLLCKCICNVQWVFFSFWKVRFHGSIFNVSRLSFYIIENCRYLWFYL